MDPAPNKLVHFTSIGVFALAIFVLLYSTTGYTGVLNALLLVAPAIELVGVLIAAFPDVEILGVRSEGAQRIERIHNALDTLSKRRDEIKECPVIDDSVVGFEEIATQMQRELQIPPPESIQSTPTVGMYLIDGSYIENFSLSSMLKKTREIERREKERFQSLGLEVLAFGLAVQLLSSILRTLHASS